MENVVELRNIYIDYKLKKYDIRAVTNVSLDIKRGKITALVGESGSGKTTLASSILSCISEPGELVNGTITLYNADGSKIVVNELDDKQVRKFRWEKVSMVFQAAQSALNPVMTILAQFEETVREHGYNWTKEEIVKKVRELLLYVKLDPERVMLCYPHELSGGMKQRVMIAFSLLFDPDLIILDEPTTALDVITQDYIFKILKKINRDFGISMLLMTHDIGVVAKFADYVGVMYAGRLMEYGSVRDIFKNGKHPYTTGLIGATPSLIADLNAMKPIGGLPPDLRDLPSGCVFNPRCPKFVSGLCDAAEPESYIVNDSLVKCILYKGM